MQTEILLKQVAAALEELQGAMDKFGKYPNTQYAGQLHERLNRANKLVSAYTVLKEQKEVSPELDLHLKIMSAEPTPPTADNTSTEVPDTKPEAKPEPELPKVEKTIDPAPAILTAVETAHPPVTKPLAVPDVEPEKTPEPVREADVKPPVIAPAKEPARLSVSINDKFRFINELFASNANEYQIALEQLNAVKTKEEADTYLKGLKNIYGWDDDHEMVKRLLVLNQNRFT